MADVTARLVGEKLLLTITNLVLTQDNSGAWVFPNVAVETLPYNEAVMTSVQFMSVQGQSLAANHVGGMNETLTQKHQSKAFPKAKTTTTFADLVPAIATNLTLTGGTVARRDGEAPMFGLLGTGYDLAAPLIDISGQDRIGITNATGSTNIAVQQKGQTPFTSSIAALNAAKNYATSIGKVVFDFGPYWLGGEANAADTKATYQASLTQLAYDHVTDRKAITGQTESPALFTYITPSIALNTATRGGVARAQHQACIDYFNGVVPAGKAAPVPIILTTPVHFMGFRDDPLGVHVTADWEHVLGDYGALAQFHCYMKASDLPLNERWPPIHPIAVTINGAEMIVTYKMRIAGTALEWGVADIPNGDGFAAQVDYGFAAYNGSTLVALNTPEIIADNQIKFTLASGTWASGYRLGYMLDIPADHHFFFKFGAGNLRDNYGNGVRSTAMNVPLHNWAGPIDITIGAGSTWSIS